MLKLYDTNHDGRLDDDEIARMGTDLDAQMKISFTMMDKNRDGFVTMDDLIAGRSFAPANAADMMEIKLGFLLAPPVLLT